MTTVAERLAQVRERISTAQQRSGRSGSVVLVAVSKSAPASSIREALDAGHWDFGENRVGDALEKARQVGSAPRWHFIGRLQRNKVAKLLPLRPLIHSVDRLDLALQIDRRATEPVDVMIEVNVSKEPSKAGVAAPDVRGLAESIMALPNLRLQGLMTMAPIASSAEESRPVFRRLSELASSLQESFPGSIHQLSMGMSQDYEVAVEEGATMVRVGQAIFGAAKEQEG